MAVPDVKESETTPSLPESADDTPTSPRAIAAAAVAEATAQCRRERDEDNDGSAATSEVKEDDNSISENFLSKITTRVDEGGDDEELLNVGDRGELRCNSIPQDNLHELGNLHMTSNSRQQEMDRSKVNLLKESISGIWEDTLSELRRCGDEDNQQLSNSMIEKLSQFAVRESSNLIIGLVEELSTLSSDALRSKEKTDYEIFRLQEDLDTKSREVERLTKGDEENRASVANLLRAIETSKGDARDICHTAQTESRLRGEISTLKEQNDKLINSEGDSKRKYKLLEEEMRILKTKLSRITQEKVKLERDARATMSLARSLDSHANSDTEFYKRKVSELNDRLQTKNALVIEQQRQLEEMRRQMERSLSQSRLAQLRMEGSIGSKRSRK